MDVFEGEFLDNVPSTAPGSGLTFTRGLETPTLTIPKETNPEELPSSLPPIGHVPTVDPNRVTWKTHESMSGGLGNRPRSHIQAAEALGQAAPSGLPGGQELGMMEGGKIVQPQGTNKADNFNGSITHKVINDKKEHQIVKGKEETRRVEGKQSDLGMHWMLQAMAQAEQDKFEHDKVLQDRANINQNLAQLHQQLASTAQTGLGFVLNNN